ncbi:MAG: thermonuclease family protein [Acidobacteria bacterium]|nr:thermonuclease family protein [Acidobacteriota bacterium]
MIRRSAAARTVLLLTVTAAALAAAPADAQLVERVVDGDTIIVQGVGRVRLIGVDTPETVHPRRPVECFGKEASAFAKRLLEGQRARLEYDQERTDRYGRTLAYVHLPNGTFANAEIVRQGYGHAYTRFPFRYLDEFRRYEREARQQGRGLWGAKCADAASREPAGGAAAAARQSGGSGALERYDDNGNGRITCAEARRHGIAPVPRGHPAYPYMRDGDGDGVVCE